jgi:arginine/lysine/ornithine decarboxylase
MLHIGKGAETSGHIDFERMTMGLSLTQSTSPSYLLLASLDLARSHIATQGECILNGVADALDEARAEIAGMPGMLALGPELAGTHGIFAYEPMRLVISAAGLGLSGYELFRILREEYGVEAEFGDPLYCVCVAGLGTTRAHVDKLTAALREISAKRHFPQKKHPDSRQNVIFNGNKDVFAPGMTFCREPASSYGVPPLAMTPREAWFAPKEHIPFAGAVGRVSGELVVPYPPGIPALCPGERVTPEIHDFLRKRREENCHLHCSAGDSLETLLVVR